MKHKILLLAVLVIVVGSATDTRGESEPQGADADNNTVEVRSLPESFAPLNNVVEWRLFYEFFVPGDTPKIKLVTALPKTIPDRQKIQWVKCFPRPLRRFTSKSGNEYAEFIFTEPKRRFKVEIQVRAELLRYDLLTAQKRYENKLFPSDGGNGFLQEESGIECNSHLIQKAARGVKGQSEIETVRSIYNHVIDNLDYCTQDQEQGAYYAAQQREGDCSEYSALFVAMCRANGIPARVVTGYAVVVSETLPKHAWAEVYLRNYGWVPFDPTWGDVEEAWLQESLFGTMKPVYIFLKYPGGDEFLEDKRNTSIQYWGDKIEMEESVEFKEWDLQRTSLKARLKENVATTKREATHGVVGGIVYTEENPSAIIDSKLLKEGQMIHGVKIIKIHEGGVEFEKDSQRWTQKTGETADLFWQ
jgi:hypothetical protein